MRKTVAQALTGWGTRDPVPRWIQKNERGKAHCGGTNQHAPTQTQRNQAAITVLTLAQRHCTTCTASQAGRYTWPIMTSALALQRQRCHASIVTQTLLMIKRDDQPTPAVHHSIPPLH